MSNQTENKGMNISAKSFAVSIAVIFALMAASYILTFCIPGGEYARTLDEAGNTVIDTAGGFSPVPGGLPFWKWLLSPILVLGIQGSGTLLAVIAFLLIIGGIFNSLETCGLMKYMLDSIVARFGAKRDTLLAVVSLFFMSLGSFIGSFEECVPLVPIVVALSVRLGWDALTGMGMSLLAVGCGFAAGICNPFTVGVAQKLAGLPMLSGMGFRAASFVLIYLLLLLFLRSHAKRVEKPLEPLSASGEFCRDRKMDRALWLFAGILGIGILLVLSSAVITVLQDYTMIIVGLMFLVSGVTASLTAGIGGKGLAKTFRKGLVNMLPGVLMILMAGSIKFTMEEAHILDTVLYGAVQLTASMPRAAVILFIYLLALVMNFFISSGSAKAFLLIPLVVPMARIFGISAQLCVLAYAFGDGFSNVFYPTNPVLLISLGLADVDYGTWAKWSWKFQVWNLLLTACLLLVGLAIGY